MSSRFWSAAEDALLRAMYPDCHALDIAAWLEKSISAVYNRAFVFGLHKSAEYLASDTACRIQRGHQNEAMKRSRFAKGQAAWNKGLRGVVGVQDACRATQFKPGSRSGAAARNWVPIGTVRVSKDGCLQRKVSEIHHSPRDWVSVHSLTWIAAKGPIPAGHVVVFKPGKKTTDEAAISVADLECLSRAELMRRNSVHTNYPPEIARLVQLRGALNRQINKRQEQHA